MGMLLSIIKASNQVVYDKDCVGFIIGNRRKGLTFAIFFFQISSKLNLLIVCLSE